MLSWIVKKKVSLEELVITALRKIITYGISGGFKCRTSETVWSCNYRTRPK
jgi:hypothetical protein